MERDGWKLPDVFDWAVPGKAAVHFGNKAKVDTVRTSLFEHILNDFAITGRSEDDLVDKFLARHMKQCVEAAENFARRRIRRCPVSAGVNEAFEGVAKVANARKMVA